VPPRKLVRAIAQADSAETAFLRALGSRTRATDARRTRDLLGPNSPEWQRVRSGYFAHLLTNAGDNVETAATAWTKVAPDVRAVFDPDGSISRVMERLTRAKPVIQRGIETFAAGHALYAAIQGRLMTAFYALLTAGASHYAGPASRIFAQGAIGSPPALRLAEEITRWGTRQFDPAVEIAAEDVASALRGEPERIQPDASGEAPPASEPPAAPAPPAATAPAARDDIEAVAALVGIPDAYLRSLVERESGGDPEARNPASGAIGLMQILPQTFETVRAETEALLGRPADIRAPLDNLIAGALYARQGLMETGGRVAAAARFYHGGPDVRAHGPRTRAYGEAVARGTRARLGGR
jgi:soluble lytic murein transglycosylase-like protein